MLADLSSKKSREEIGISEDIYFDILNFKKSHGEKEFFDLLEECIISLDQANSDWPGQHLLNFESSSLSLTMPGNSYPSKGGENSISWRESIQTRPEIRLMLDSENQDIRYWASNFMHENECFVTIDCNPKPVDSDTYLVESVRLLQANQYHASRQPKSAC